MATHNGARWLPQVLEGYERQTAPRTSWKLVIVDNGSLDNTLEVIGRFADSLPLYWCEERTPGKNAALNTGLKLVEGDLLILTDDDAIPEPDFVASWISLRDRYEEYDLFGGRITPTFERPPPAWLDSLWRRDRTLFATRDLRTGEVDALEIFGPNMCVRTRVIESGVRFNERIGPNSTDADYAMGSETSFCRDVAARDYRAYFFAEAGVKHIVRSNQMTLDYYGRCAYRNGRGNVLRQSFEGAVEQNPWHHLRLRRYAPFDVQHSWLKLKYLFAVGAFNRARALWALRWWEGYRHQAQLHDTRVPSECAGSSAP